MFHRSNEIFVVSASVLRAFHAKLDSSIWLYRDLANPS